MKLMAEYIQERRKMKVSIRKTTVTAINKENSRLVEESMWGSVNNRKGYSTDMPLTSLQALLKTRAANPLMITPPSGNKGVCILWPHTHYTSKERHLYCFVTMAFRENEHVLARIRKEAKANGITSIMINGRDI